jgi:trehalose 6-phosphate phosphatase
MTEPQHAPANGTPVKLAIFTDFDGTLVDIAETPDGIDVPANLAEQIARAAGELDSAFAVLTGREIADIDRYLSPLQLPIAGAHGSQRRRADGSLETLDPEIIAAAHALADHLDPLLAANPDLIVEHKDGAVAVHFRRAPELEHACRIAMEEATFADPRFELVSGKMVIEARPRGLTKGTALRAFMQEAPFAGRTPIFIGDDVTDEDGFAAAQDLGGVGIKLGAGTTIARMRIANVASVHSLIEGLGTIAAHGLPAPSLQ